MSEDKGGELKDEEDSPSMGWPAAVAVAVKSIVLLLIVAVMAQCETGRIW